MNDKRTPMFFKKYMYKKKTMFKTGFTFLFFISSSFRIFLTHESNSFCFWSATRFSTCDFSSYFHCFKLICFYRIISKFIITLCNNSLIKFFKWISIWSTAGISFIICFKQSSFQFLTFSLHFLAKTWLYCWYDHLTFLIRHLSIGIVWDSSLLVRIWSSTTHWAIRLSLCRFSTSFYWH